MQVNLLAVKKKISTELTMIEIAISEPMPVGPVQPWLSPLPNFKALICFRIGS